MPPIQGPTYTAVLNFKQASLIVRAYIKKNELGAGNWAGGGIYDDTGSVVAYVSYNGRVWGAGEKEIKL